jgi:hypothetical protein
MGVRFASRSDGLAQGGADKVLAGNGLNSHEVMGMGLLQCRLEAVLVYLFSLPCNLLRIL